MRVIIQILIPLLLMINSSTGIQISQPVANDGLDNSFAIKTERLPRFAKYDFIVVGSGPGGSPVANRLSENKTWKILLLEAGKPEGILHQMPTYSAINTEYDWQYKTDPQKKACLGLIDRKCPYVKGKSLGGSSSINGMVYARGHKLDFDLWAAQGNYGWTYDEVLPYFKKSERANLREPEDKRYHGKNGYLHVQNAPRRGRLAEAFLKSGQKLGYDVIDYNGRKQIGFSVNQLTMVNGTRCSASKAYLQVRRSNLDIVPEARVSRILIDDRNRAYGVEFIKSNNTYRINAHKEVILSAGAVGTPKLLMLSGIGPKEHLTELGIEVVQNSKVGYNLCDHVSFAGVTFLVNQNATPMARNDSVGIGNGALAFTRTKYATDTRPDLELIFGAVSVNTITAAYMKSRRVTGATKEVYDKVWKPIERGEAWAIWPAVQLPRSKGRIKLKSTNIEDPPIIDPNLLDDQNDVEVLVEGVKLAIELSKSKAFQKYGNKLHDMKIPGCESFKFASDNYWRCAIRHATAASLHDMGTAKMGPSIDADAVVDPQLRVHGIEGLRVIDASIMPNMPVGHLSATIYMIAEKGADMIKQAWTKDM